MATNEAAVSPAEVPASKQPPENSVWIRYHPWIEGVMAHVSAWSIHLLVIGGAVLWFTYLAYALGFAHAPRSLPMEAVRLEIAGGGGSKTGSGTQQGDEGHARTEDAATDNSNSGTKNTAVDDSDRLKLTDVQKKEIDLKIPPTDPRSIKQDVGSFDKLNKDIRDKLGSGINPSKGNGGTGTGGGTGAGTGTGRGTGTVAGTEQPLNKREKRQIRWFMKLNPKSAEDYLSKLQAVGAVVAVVVAPNTLEVVDLNLPSRKPKVTKLSSMKELHWVDEDPKTFRPLLEILALPVDANVMIAYMPVELEDELLKQELAYHNLKEEEISETYFIVKIPGSDGRKYDIQVIDQKAK